MSTHAGAIAAKLQGAHERRKRGEDTNMSQEATTEQVQQFGSSVWDDDPFVHAMKLTERLGKVLGDIAASGHAPGNPQASAVNAERVVELERQLADALYNAEEFRKTRDSSSAALKDALRRVELAEEAAHAVSNALHGAYVAREVPWADVAAGMMTISKGEHPTPWMVTDVADSGLVTLVNGGQTFPKNPKPGETVRVLVPYVTPEQAEGLVRDGLGAVRA